MPRHSAPRCAGSLPTLTLDVRWPLAREWLGTHCRRGRRSRRELPERSMNTFSADWLAIREPADAAARSSRLAQLVARILTGIDPLRIVDLAAGTGANVRYLAEYLPSREEWLLVDHDRDLLDRALTMMPSSIARDGGRIDTQEIDLRTIADGQPSAIFAGRALVTASALLDLVSDAWLQA